MANEQNLKPIRDSQRARELQEKAAEKQRENIARRKTLRDELIALLAQGDTQSRMSLSIISKALNGDTKAFEVIRDTIGEKPTDKVEQSGEQKMIISVQGDVHEWSK